METKANKPVHTVRSGTLSASVWEDTAKTKEGREFKTYNLKFEKSYKDGEEWKTTQYYRANELPRLKLLIEKAYEHIMLNTDSE